MDGLVVAAIILGTIAVVLVGAGLSEYRTAVALLSYEEKAMREGTYCYGCPSILTVSIGGAYFKFGVGAALGAAGFVVYLMNRTAEKDRRRYQLSDA
jgi:hypothetical protein